MIVFYGDVNYDIADSINIYLLDPKYYDEKIILVQVRGIFSIDN